MTIGGGGGIVAFSATFVEAAARSQALATGLAGDRFDAGTLLGLPIAGGNDWLESAGAVKVRSTAETRGTDVSVAIAVGIGGSVNLLEAAASSLAVATGHDGGAGNDTLIARGAVDAGADAETEALSVQVALVGANIGDVSTQATARATGLAGGAGSDRIEAHGEVRSKARAATDTTAAGFVFTGASLGDMATRATAEATGIDGGTGNDLILTRGLVDAKSDASAPLRTIQIALTGGAVADAASSATAASTGISGGEGDNVLDIGGAVLATSTSTISAKSIGVNVTGLSQSDVTATASSTATAIAAGGTGGVSGIIGGALTATSFATGSIDSLSVTLLGVGNTTAGAGADATATAVAGGGGKDSLILERSSTVFAQGASSVGGTSVTLTGLQLSRPQGSTTATAALADLGTGNDSLLVRASAGVTALATATADTGTYTLLGGALGVQGADASAQAMAASGGDGDDVLILDAPVSVSATGLATARNQGVTILGGSVGAARGKALGSAVGLDGGTGSDWLENRGSLVLRGTGSASFSGTVGNFLGAGIVRSRLEQEGRVLGLAGGAGADSLLNAGFIDGLATAAASTQAMNVTLLG